jgi:SAM-dependent methyltransferase
MGKIILNRLRRLVNNEYMRQEWVRGRLYEIPENSTILDAGCGSQQYRKNCKHLKYYAQDFGNYKKDKKDSLTARTQPYNYGKLDYMGNIWSIDEKDSTFNVILCTEVLEHIPYPNETIKEFSRLLKPGGKLILTVPSNSLRHMDPYYYYSGYSDRYLKLILEENRFHDIKIESIGSYHSWLMVETSRCIRYEGLFALLTLWPAFIYHYLKQRSPSHKEINTLCFGYHVTAIKPMKF